MTIKIKNRFFETMLNEKMKSIVKRDFTATTSYWLAVIIEDKIEPLSKHYFQQKQKLIEKYALRYEEDTGKNKKGDIVSDGNNVSLKEPEKFTKELESILDIENDLGIKKIKFDFKEEPKIPIEEMMFIRPFIEEIKNG